MASGPSFLNVCGASPQLQQRGGAAVYFRMDSCWPRSRWRRSLAAGSSLAGLLLACGGTPDAGADGPVVIHTVPSNGEDDVDSELGALSVTFSEAMGQGWSWVTETGHAAPEVQGFAFYIDEVTNVLPVKLAPHTDYAIWVNSPDHEELRKFANPDGVSARAYRIQFETR